MEGYRDRDFASDKEYLEKCCDIHFIYLLNCYIMDIMWLKHSTES